MSAQQPGTLRVGGMQAAWTVPLPQMVRVAQTFASPGRCDVEGEIRSPGHSPTGPTARSTVASRDEERYRYSMALITLFVGSSNRGNSVTISSGDARCVIHGARSIVSSSSVRRT